MSIEFWIAGISSTFMIVSFVMKTKRYNYRGDELPFELFYNMGLALSQVVCAIIIWREVLEIMK